MATSKNSSKIVTEMAKATGVAEADVSKILNQLGLGRISADALKSNGGKEVGLAAARVALKVGKSTVIV
jgi:hypothetical protein